jgi:hypothetical protein
MIRKTTLSALILAVFAALMALALLATPALAGPDKAKEKGGNSASAKGDKDGDADSDPNTEYTEDNDTNDGGTPNNVPDEGDNAHPSGKDRSVEHGKSGNQGKSESNPDDSKGPMRYEGEPGDDKPNGPGGTDLADQDGNNGCGNDDDFDDDNNGWCGKPKKDKPETPEEPCDDNPEMPGTQPCDEEEPPVVGGTPPVCDKNPDMPGTQPCDDTDVDGDIITETPEVDDDDDVLGGVISRPPAGAPAVRPARTTRGGALPFTGTSWAIAYFVIGLGLLTAGAAALRFAKK